MSMESWIEFARGPLFRLSFAIMVLGVLRLLWLTGVGIVEAYRRNSDRRLAYREIVRQTLEWAFPIRRVGRARPLYSIASVLFHVSLLLVPLLLYAHVLLWRRAIGFGWPVLSKRAADGLTLLMLAAAIGLFVGRLANRQSRALSRLQDYVWPLLLAVPFATGYACANLVLPPRGYQACMLLHLLSANTVMSLIPFTKIAHCVLQPLSQLVTALSWKFVPGAGDQVAATLGYSERPSWAEKARIGDSRS
jgi:nitrate reductase gamma subunit